MTLILEKVNHTKPKPGKVTVQDIVERLTTVPLPTLEEFETIVHASQSNIYARSHRSAAMFEIGNGGVPNLYEFFTLEYAKALKAYLFERYTKQVRILEVGAGRGHFARQMRELGAQWLAIDDGSWDESVRTDWHNVAKASIESDLLHLTRHHKIDVIFQSWMPYEADFSVFFRECPIEEYILLGETDCGCCGSYEMWGGTSDWENDIHTPPGYEKDGWRRVNLDKLPSNPCRTDELGSYYHSQTVSFRRS